MSGGDLLAYAVAYFGAAGILAISLSRLGPFALPPLALALIIGGLPMVTDLLAYAIIASGLVVLSYIAILIAALMVYGGFFVWSVVGTWAVFQMVMISSVMIGLWVFVGGPFNPISSFAQVTAAFGQRADQH